MKSLISAAILTVTLIAAPVDPVAWKLQSTAAAPLKAGTRFPVKLLASVGEGWHLYSLKPMVEGPIATRIWIAGGQPFSQAGVVQAPDPQVMQDPTLGMEVEFYEGEALFTLPVKSAPDTTPGEHNLAVSVSYQTCNDKLCLPPKTVKLDLPIRIAK